MATHRGAFFSRFFTYFRRSKTYYTRKRCHTIHSLTVDCYLPTFPIEEGKCTYVDLNTNRLSDHVNKATDNHLLILTSVSPARNRKTRAALLVCNANWKGAGRMGVHLSY